MMSRVGRGPTKPVTLLVLLLGFKTQHHNHLHFNVTNTMLHALLFYYFTKLLLLLFFQLFIGPSINICIVIIKIRLRLNQLAHNILNIVSKFGIEIIQKFKVVNLQY